MRNMIFAIDIRNLQQKAAGSFEQYEVAERLRPLFQHYFKKLANARSTWLRGEIPGFHLPIPANFIMYATMKYRLCDASVEADTEAIFSHVLNTLRDFGYDRKDGASSKNPSTSSVEIANRLEPCLDEQESSRSLHGDTMAALGQETFSQLYTVIT